MKAVREKVLLGITEKISSPRGSVYVTVNSQNNEIFEVFCRAQDQEAAAIGRLCALALRSGGSVDELIEQLWKVDSNEVVSDVSENGTVVHVRSISQAVGLMLGRTLYGSSWKGPFSDRKDLMDGKAAKQKRKPISKNGNTKPVADNVTKEATITEDKTEPGFAAKVLQETTEPKQPSKDRFQGICPDCAGKLTFAEGCKKCLACGYSRC